MGLRLRLILILTVTAIVVVGAHGLLRLRYDASSLLEENRRSVESRAAAIQSALENVLETRALGELGPMLTEMLSKQDGRDRVRLFDRDLRLRHVYTPPGLDEEVAVDVLRRVRDTGRPEGFRRQQPGGSANYYVVALRDRAGRTQGVIEVAHLASDVDRRVEAGTRDLWLRLGLLVVALVTVTGLVLHRQVARPVSQLVKRIESLGRGEQIAPLPVKRRDELGRLAEAFNKMAAQLETARQKLIEEAARTVDLERQLWQGAALAALGKVASGVAHEVGTPLNVISGRAELLLNTLPPNDPGRTDLQAIVAQIDRISTIIRSLLDTTRPQAPDLVAVALDGVLNRLLPLLRYTARRRDVALTASVPGDLPPVLGDPNQLQQVLINLVVNALEATPAGGRVSVNATLQTRNERAGVNVTVTDTGPGIPAAEIDRVFDAFFTTKPAGHGTGLGLAICRDIITAHHGNITVESAVGAGTTFTVWIPQAETTRP